MDYGAILFGTAAQTHFHNFYVNQNQDLRQILEAIKATPIAAMDIEANLPWTKILHTFCILI